MSDKKKRIAGAAFWKIQKVLQDIEKQAKELREWREEQAQKLEAYPYQLNWGLGVVYEMDCEVSTVGGREVVTNGKIQGKIPQEILDEDKAKRDVIENADRTLGEFRDKIAKKLAVHRDDINLKSGVIAEGEYDDLELDLDSLDEPTKKKSKKDKKGELD